MKDKIVDILKLVFSKYRYTLICFLYFVAIGIYPIGMIPRPTFIVGAASLLLILNIFSKIKYNGFLIFLFCIIVILDAVFAFQYSAPLSIGMVGSLFETNVAEAISMMGQEIVPVSILTILTFFLVIKSVKELKNWKLKKRYSLLIVLAYLIVLYPFSMHQAKKVGLKFGVKQAPIHTYQIMISSYSPVFYGSSMAIILYINEIHTFHKYRGKERVMSDGISPSEKSTFEKPKKIILVVGESASPTRFSLYGYDKPTTPFLDSLYADTLKNSSLQYYDAITAASFTRSAVTILLSTSTAQDPYRFYEEKTIIDLANDAGYRTSWISNQPRTQLENLVANYIAEVASASDYEDFVYEETGLDDLNLIAKVREQIGKQEYEFIIVHLIGSHGGYWDKSDEKDAELFPGEEHEIYYDRSIHHTDRVLRELWKIANQYDSSLLLYTSDHGEDVGVGHGVIPVSAIQFITPLVTINKSEVPLDSIADRYKDTEFNYYSTSNTIYIMAEALGYSISDSLTQNSIELSRQVVHGDGTLHQFSDLVKKAKNNR